MPRMYIIHAATPVQEATPSYITPTPFAALRPRATDTSSLSSTSFSDFFPDPSKVTPSPQPDQGQGGGTTIAKSLLEYAILAVGLVVIGCIITQRLIRLRRANLPLTSFFSLSYREPPTPTHRPTFPRTHGLNDAPAYPYPAAYHPSLRRIRALDTDDGGRRLDTGGPNDHDGYLGDKDMLPAYDNVGGPPKYFELDTFRGPARAVGATDTREAQPGAGGQEPESEGGTRGGPTPGAVVVGVGEPPAPGYTGSAPPLPGDLPPAAASR